MKRILFVDDQQVVLNAHRASMEKYRGQADLVFADGGNSALEVLRNSPIDVIVSDMYMPGMDGHALLETVKADYPDLIRIMLCPLSNPEAVFAALTVSHQVLNKPLDADCLWNGIERTCRLRDLLSDSLRDKIGGIEQLPSVPAVYKELMTAIARPDVTATQIARIVESDSAMAAKTLQLVNSTCFSISRSVSRLDHAVSYLGMELIQNLCLTVHIFSSFNRTASRMGISFEAEQEHSILVARIARRLVSNPRQAENAFAAALLHNIGNLVLAVCLPKQFKKVIHACSLSGRPAHEVETEMIGASHAEVGAYLLGLWGVPFPIVEAVAFHHAPGAALERTFDIPTAVCLANALVEDLKGIRPFALHQHLKSLKVSGKLAGWMAIAEEESQQMPMLDALFAL